MSLPDPQRGETPGAFPAGLAVFALTLGGMVLAACASGPSPKPEEQGPVLPAWFDPGGLPVEAALELEQAASLICGRGQGSVVDDEVRQLAGVYDGLITAQVVVGTDPTALRARLAKDARDLLVELQATHVGFAEGQLMGSERCAAMVGVRRLIEVQSDLPVQLEPEEAFPLRFRPRTKKLGGSATLFAMNPLGFVTRRELTGSDDGAFEDVVLPSRLAGRWFLELMVEATPGDPEVALLWPVQVGEGGNVRPPHPEVLFPDEGHNDLALTRRAEALVQRLRTQQEISVFRIAPPLSRVAQIRAGALAEAAGLGHQRPGRDPFTDVTEREPRFGFSRLAEVQAQAGTLAEAWAAMLQSPAHRYQLVRPSMTHFGAAVVRSEDGGGRPLITLVVLLVRRAPPRQLKELRTELIGKLNLARHQGGLKPLRTLPVLDEVCTEQAEAMARTGSLDEELLGEPVAQRALTAAQGLDEVRVVLAAVDDPLRLKPSPATLRPSMRDVGVAIRESRTGPDARYLVCILVGGPGKDGP